MENWKCTICSFVGGGEDVPNRCPECGARDTMFEASDETPHGIPHNPFQPRDEHEQHAVILGPGHGCVEGD